VREARPQNFKGGARPEEGSLKPPTTNRKNGQARDEKKGFGRGLLDWSDGGKTQKQMPDVGALKSNPIGRIRARRRGGGSPPQGSGKKMSQEEFRETWEKVREGSLSHSVKKGKLLTLKGRLKGAAVRNWALGTKDGGG